VIERRGRLLFVAQKEEEGLALGPFLRRRGLSLTVVRSQKHLNDGLLVNGCRARTNQKLKTGDSIELRMPGEAAFSARPQRLPVDVVYESAEALVLDKLAGMAMHPGPGIHTKTLANAVCGLYSLHFDGGVFRPVGRLDADTSGLALCAQTAASAKKLAASARKVYIALVWGRMPLGPGEVNAPLAAQTGSAVRQQVRPGGRPSKTQYEVLAACPRASLVLARPHTGRTHQIRAHMAGLGHPLLGDELYGGPAGFIKRHALHCAAIQFEELGGNRIGLCRRPPDDMLAAAGLLWPKRAGEMLKAAMSRAQRLLGP
jgi:23S rRNA pseudouridine1911/1915/1917 synthase